MHGKAIEDILEGILGEKPRKVPGHRSDGSPWKISDKDPRGIHPVFKLLEEY